MKAKAVIIAQWNAAVVDNSRVIADNYNNIIFVSAKRCKTIIKEIGEK
jgi:hypothetical protein